MSHSYTKSRRCRWYDDDGQPRVMRDGRRGCDFSNTVCHFAHPIDPEWTQAMPTKPPPPHQLSGQNRPRPERPRNASGQPYTAARSISPPSGPSSSRPPLSKQTASSPNLTRKDTVESTSSMYRRRDRDGDVQMRDRSPTGSSVSHDNRDRDRERTYSNFGFRRGTETEREREKDKEREKENREETRPSNATFKPPPVPPLPVLKPVAPNTPNANPPSAAAGSKKDATLEDKLEVWVQRIKTLADAVNMRVDYVRIEREVLSFKQMYNSKRLVDISEETRERLSKQLTELEAQWDKKRTELNAAVFRLIDAEYWPVVSQPLDPMSPDERFRFMRETVWELRDKVKELSEAMKQVNERLEASKPVPPPATSTVVEAAGPPLKRRKMSDPEEAAEAPSPAEPSSSTSVPVHASLDAEQLNTITEQFTSLETRLEDLENELVQADRNVLEQLEEKLEERLGQLNMRDGQSAEGSGGRAEAPPDTGQQDAKQLAALQTIVSGVSNDIEELAGEVANMISNSGGIEDEVQRLTKENEEMRKQIAKLQEQHKSTGDELTNQRAELNALNAALTTLISQPPHPPPPPLNDASMLLETLLPPLLAAVQQNVEPRVAELRRDVEELISAQNEELSATVISKLGNASRAMEVIKNWMDKVLQDGSASAVHIVSPTVGPLQVSNGVRAIPPAVPGKPT